jgi:hypothetical protein
VFAYFVFDDTQKIFSIYIFSIWLGVNRLFHYNRPAKSTPKISRQAITNAATIFHTVFHSMKFPSPMPYKKRRKNAKKKKRDEKKNLLSPPKSLSSTSPPFCTGSQNPKKRQKKFQVRRTTYIPHTYPPKKCHLNLGHTYLIHTPQKVPS